MDSFRPSFCRSVEALGPILARPRHGGVSSAGRPGAGRGEGLLPAHPGLEHCHGEAVRQEVVGQGRPQGYSRYYLGPFYLSNVT